MSWWQYLLWNSCRWLRLLPYAKRCVLLGQVTLLSERSDMWRSTSAVYAEFTFDALEFTDVQITQAMIMGIMATSDLMTNEDIGDDN
jgi:hypothetical protein